MVSIAVGQTSHLGIAAESAVCILLLCAIAVIIALIRRVRAANRHNQKLQTQLRIANQVNDRLEAKLATDSTLKAHAHQLQRKTKAARKAVGNG